MPSKASQTSSAKPITFSAKRTGPRVTARSLIDVLERAIKWLRTLDPHVPIDWEVVRIRMGKTVSLTFSNPNVNGAVSNNMNKLSTLQRKRGPKVMPTLSDAVIESTRELAELFNSGFESINISSAERQL